jgi:hypothetical protein
LRIKSIELDHSANVAVSRTSRSYWSNLATGQDRYRCDESACGAVTEGHNELEERLLGSQVNLEDASLAVIGRTWKSERCTA